MTKIQLAQAGGRYRLTARGHATGSEKVCAGISAIVYALAGWLANAEKTGAAYVESLRLDSADVEIIFSGGSEAEAVFLMAEVGLLQIQLQYSEFLRVNTA